MTLTNARTGKEYFIEAVNSTDDEISSFLYSLGCLKGGLISVIERKKHNFILKLQGAKYSVDSNLADLIEIKEKMEEKS